MTQKHWHSCPVCYQEREPEDCPRAAEQDACWEACPQHRQDWQDQIDSRPGAFQ